MIKFVGLRAKSYSNLMDNGSEYKKAKGIKNCNIKSKTKFENYENRLKATKLDNIIKYLEKKLN